MKIADPQSLVRKRRVRIRVPAEPAPDLRIRIIRQDRIVSGRRVYPTQAPRPVSTPPYSKPSTGSNSRPHDTLLESTEIAQDVTRDLTEPVDVAELERRMALQVLAHVVVVAG